jgi:hypothetical protein
MHPNSPNERGEARCWYATWRAQWPVTSFPEDAFHLLWQQSQSWIQGYIRETHLFYDTNHSHRHCSHEAMVLLWVATQRLRTGMPIQQCNSFLKKHVRYGLWQWVKHQKHLYAHEDVWPSVGQNALPQPSSASCLAMPDVLDTLIQQETYATLHRVIRMYLPPQEQNALYWHHGFDQSHLSKDAGAPSIPVPAKLHRGKHQRMLKRLKRYVLCRLSD